MERMLPQRPSMRQQRPSIVRTLACCVTQSLAARNLSLAMAMQPASPKIVQASALFSNVESAKKTAALLSQAPTCVTPLLKNVEGENPGWWDSLVSSTDRKTSPGLLLQVLAAIVTSVMVGVGSCT